MLSAAEIIRLLDLKPHPEGGYFRETFRDARTIDGRRAASTAIHFLLARGDRSHWHRVDAVEIWLAAARRPLPPGEPGILGGVEMGEGEPHRRETAAELTHEILIGQRLTRAKETHVRPAVVCELLAELGEHGWKRS